MKRSITVIVCTRNPLVSRFEKVLNGLKSQTLDTRIWDLIIVDNGSTPPLKEQLDMRGLPNGKIIEEPMAGLTHARLRGIRETETDLVYVDDDNVLSPSYLEEVLKCFESKPWIGAFGGNVCLSFEGPVPGWINPLRPMLAEREVTRDRWSCSYEGNMSIPCGAGMAVRREVAEAYRERLEGDEALTKLDRTGESLISDGDTDLALTAVDIGLATGQMAALSLEHLIPEGRLTREYLCRLAHGMAYSGVMVRASRIESRKALRMPTRFEKLRERWQWVRMDANRRAVAQAWARGNGEGLKQVGVIK